MSLLLSIIFCIGGTISMFSGDTTKGLMAFALSALFSIAYHLGRIDEHVGGGE